MQFYALELWNNNKAKANLAVKGKKRVIYHPHIAINLLKNTFGELPFTPSPQKIPKQTHKKWNLTDIQNKLVATISFNLFLWLGRR